MSTNFKLRLTCPVSKQWFECPTREDFDYIRDRWNEAIGAFCPYCKRIHRFSFKEAYMETKVASESVMQ